MGIKENFTQALKELSGTAKEQSDRTEKSKTTQVEDLRRALEAEAVERQESPISEVAADTVELPTTVHEPSEMTSVPTDSTFTQSPTFAPKASHAGLDLNIRELRQASDASEQFFSSAQNEPSPVSSPFGSSFIQPSFPAFTQSEPSPVASPFGQTPFTAAPKSEPSPIGTPFSQNGFSTAMAEAMGEASDIAEELTIISKNTVVEGNVRSFANMSIEGNIRGDVETTKNIDLNGKVIGNLTCNNAQMLTSQIQGNIRMKGSILMGRDTLLIGDLVSTYAKVNGKVKGNLEIGGKAELKSDAVIFGDISASTITVDDGAIIQGYVSTTFLNKEESRNIFPEAVSIAE
ncbi:MAG: polymer-forming cytoskeletal protein [Oscillospiraceae bacterium]|nr:polymer-forming cytoskeletal protein [Oscillospiraceae bacterium]